eukprot:gene29928-16689_t
MMVWTMMRGQRQFPQSVWGTITDAAATSATAAVATATLAAESPQQQQQQPDFLK